MVQGCTRVSSGGPSNERRANLLQSYTGWIKAHVKSSRSVSRSNNRSVSRSAGGSASR